MSNRRRKGADRDQNGNWLDRLHKDGVLPRGRKGKAKRKLPAKLKSKRVKSEIIRGKTSKSPIKREKKIDFDHSQFRLLKAAVKVQFEWVNLEISKAKKEGYECISIGFELDKGTVEFLTSNKNLVSKDQKRITW